MLRKIYDYKRICALNHVIEYTLIITYTYGNSNRHYKNNIILPRIFPLCLLLFIVIYAIMNAKD